jgi:hypothetical protein
MCASCIIVAQLLWAKGVWRCDLCQIIQRRAPNALLPLSCKYKHKNPINTYQALDIISVRHYDFVVFASQVRTRGEFEGSRMLTKLENKKLMQWALCLLLASGASLNALDPVAQEEEEFDTAGQVEGAQVSDDEDEDDQSVHGIVGVAAGYRSETVIKSAGRPVTQPGTFGLAFEIGGATSIAKDVELGLTALVRWFQTSEEQLQTGAISQAAMLRLVRYFPINDGIRASLGFVCGAERESVQVGSRHLPSPAMSVGGLLGIVMPLGPVEVALNAKLLRRGASDHGDNSGWDIPLINGVHPEEQAKIQEDFNRKMVSYLKDIRVASAKGGISADRKIEQLLDSLFRSLPDVSVTQIRKSLSRSSDPNRPGVAVAQTAPTGGAAISPALARRALMIRLCIEKLRKERTAIVAMVDGIHSQRSDARMSIDSDLRMAFLELRDAIDAQGIDVVVSSRASNALINLLASFRAELGVELRINPSTLVAKI